MPKFVETKIFNYQSEQIYDLVLDVESYPEFLPWCKAARIIERHVDYLIADLVISYKGFTEKYRSKVSFNSSESDYFINVSLIDGPFTYLTNTWSLHKIEHGTEIKFLVDFSFKSILLEKIIGLIFNQAAQKMVSAFKNRAEEIYDNKT